MVEAILDPTMTDSDKPTETAFNVAFNTADDFWTWLQRPGNEKRNIRFIMAMNNLNRLDNEQNVLQGDRVANLSMMRLIQYLEQVFRGIAYRMEQR